MADVEISPVIQVSVTTTVVARGPLWIVVKRPGWTGLVTTLSADEINLSHAAGLNWETLKEKK